MSQYTLLQLLARSMCVRWVGPGLVAKTAAMAVLEAKVQTHAILMDQSAIASRLAVV
jgi:hypothetical protein